MFRRVLPLVALIVAAGIILGMGAMGSPRTREPRGAPVLRLDESIERLAPAPPGTHVTARFTLHNDGSGPMRVSYLQSSCGCVKAELSRREVPPGEAAELQAQVLVPRVGRRTSRIQFFTNSAKREPVTLTVIAQSDVPVPYVIGESDHGAVFNGWLTEGMRRSAVVRTREAAGSAPWLCRFEADLPYVSVRRLEVAEAPCSEEPDEIERTYRLELSLTGDLPGSRVQGRFVAFAAQQTAAAVAAPVLVDPAEAVELVPSAAYLTPDAAGKPKAVYVRSMQPNFDLECSVQEPVPAGIQVRPGRRSNATREFLISLADPAALQAAAGGAARCEIVFVTNHPEVRRLTLPVVLRR